MPANRRAARPLLVLDVGGVLLVDPIPILFDRLAETSGRPRDEIYGYYKANIRDGFWAGEISEAAFWTALFDVSGLDHGRIAAWQDEIVAWQTPLPAVARLHAWSEIADIEILSNHLTHWIRPLLAEAGVDLPPAGVDRPGLVRRALVSAETGLVKPQVEAFRAALEIAPPDGRVVFADDQSPNVRTARETGLPSIEVDRDGRWMESIDRWLEEA